MPINQVSTDYIVEKKRQQSSNILNFKKSNEIANYDSKFFKGEGQSSIKSAKHIVPLVQSIVNPRSVLDVGCGVGAFLKEFEKIGVEDVLGIDNTIASQEFLQIKKDKIKQCDICKPLELSKKFDLVISLEVGEHLDPQCSDTYVTNLTAAGNIILFSAAIPGQGGTHHVNEQWPEYWARIFERHGFKAVDCVRPIIWNSKDIDPIYAQNTLLYVKNENLDKLNLKSIQDPNIATVPLSLVHPRLYLYSKENSIKIYNTVLRNFIRSFQNFYKHIQKQ